MGRILDWFLGRPTPPQTPALRNRAGGMAWVQGVVDYGGSGILNGRAVRTVRAVQDGKWEIDPPQFYFATADVLRPERGWSVRRGDVVEIRLIADHCLVPWKDDGVRDEEVRELYTPGPAIKAPAPADSSN